jgi:chromate transporter
MHTRPNCRHTATFVGYKLKKIIGSIVATVGVIMPSVIVIML